MVFLYLIKKRGLMSIAFELVPAYDLTQNISDIFDRYSEEKAEILKIASFMKDAEATKYFIEGNGGAGISYAARELFKEEGAIRALNSRYWSEVVRLSGVLSYMTAKKRNEWSEQIREMTTPDFEMQLVLDTIENLLLSRESFIAEKVEGIFNRLSRNHVTNSPMAFRERMIMSGVINSYDIICSNATEYINDLRGIIAKVYDRDSSGVSTYNDLYSIKADKAFGEWHDFDGGAFKLRLYKVGTVHIEIHPEVANKLNRILAFKYPGVIATKEHEKELSKKIKYVPLRSVEVSGSTLSLVRTIAERWNNAKGEYFVFGEDSKSEEFIEIIKRLDGEYDGNYVKFDYNPVPAFKYIARTGCIPNKKDYQFYPTSEELADDMVNLLRIDYRSEVLEPSAGTGRLADAVKERYPHKAQITCVEIDQLNCEVLIGKGFKTLKHDFLEFKSKEGFDAVIMNPPFNKGQAQAHVIKAYSLLKKDGVIVACLPSSFRGKEIIPGVDHQYSVIYEGAFEEEGTSVNVVILKITKK